MPSAWIAPDGSVVRAGDVVRFRARGMLRTGAVLRYLTFDDHVVVGAGPCGTVVDASNFVAFVRKARRRSDGSFALLNAARASGHLVIVRSPELPS